MATPEKLPAADEAGGEVSLRSIGLARTSAPQHPSAHPTEGPNSAHLVPVAPASTPKAVFESPKLKLYRYLRYFATPCGWLFYVYEMVHVLSRAQWQEEVNFACMLISALVLMHVSIYQWIAHNKRLAAVGKRTHMPRYLSPEFLKDHLGRKLFFCDRFHFGREIVISVQGDSKFCTAAAEAQE